MRKRNAFGEMLTLKGISEASALRHIAKEVACPASVDREQLASLGSDLQQQPGDAGGDKDRGHWSCPVLVTAATAAAIALGLQSPMWTEDWRFYQ